MRLLCLLKIRPIAPTQTIACRGRKKKRKEKKEKKKKRKKRKKEKRKIACSPLYTHSCCGGATVGIMPMVKAGALKASISCGV